MYSQFSDGNVIFPYYQRKHIYLDGILIYRSTFGIEFFKAHLGIGLGMSIGKSSLNLMNDNQPYDYSVLGLSSIIDDEAVFNFFDDTFETEILINTILPHMVVNGGITYDITEGFILGIDLRIQNSFSDMLDGVIFDENIGFENNNDIHVIATLSAVFEIYSE